jgi:hypothetical protein
MVVAGTARAWGMALTKLGEVAENAPRFFCYLRDLVRLRRTILGSIFHSKTAEASSQFSSTKEFIVTQIYTRRILSTFVCVLALFMGLPTFAHEDRAPTGAWKGVVRFTTEQWPPLTTLLTFTADGNLVESRRLYLQESPLGPLLATPGHGEWRRSKNGGFDATIVVLYQGASEHPTSPGIVIGREKVRYKLQLANGGQQLQGTILVEVQDAEGNVVSSDPGTIEATRIRPEPLP